MSLQVENNDRYAVEVCGQDEWLNFWEVASTSMSGYEFAHPDEEKGRQVEELIQDANRIRRQTAELDRLMPSHKERNASELRQAMNEIERKIKKILGNQVKYTPEPA